MFLDHSVLLLKMNRNRQPRTFKYFLAEVFILVLGISASFILNEWRLTQKESIQQQDLLENFKSNFVTDSTIISSAIQNLDFQIEKGKQVLQNNENVYSDSLVFQVLSLLTYVPFRSNDITYEEMKSLGSSNIIKSDTLRAQIIGVYENGYELLNSWVDVDGEHVRTKMIPYVEQNFPFALNFQYFSSSQADKRRLTAAIQADEFKHLVQFGVSYKTNSKSIFELMLAELKETIELIDAELNEP